MCKGSSCTSVPKCKSCKNRKLHRKRGSSENFKKSLIKTGKFLLPLAIKAGKKHLPSLLNSISRSF